MTCNQCDSRQKGQIRSSGFSGILFFVHRMSRLRSNSGRCPKGMSGSSQEPTYGVLLLLLTAVWALQLYIKSLGFWSLQQRYSHCFQPFHKYDSDDLMYHVLECSLSFLEHLPDIAPSIRGMQPIYSFRMSKTHLWFRIVMTFKQLRDQQSSFSFFLRIGKRIEGTQ